jgi:NADH-quinone oxidoreductase subunit K
MESSVIRDSLVLAGILFALGLAGVLVRRDILFVLLSIEVMLNAAGLAFISAGARWRQPDGQVVFLFILTMAAAEVAVGLALVLAFYHRYKSLDADAASRMKG